MERSNIDINCIIATVWTDLARVSSIQVLYLEIWTLIPAEGCMQELGVLVCITAQAAGYNMNPQGRGRITWMFGGRIDHGMSTCLGEGACLQTQIGNNE